MTSPPRVKGTVGGIFFDATFLRFAGVRGIAQVIYLMVDILAESEFQGKVSYLAYTDVMRLLTARGIPSDQILLVPEIPWIGKIERFHGLGSTRRYRRVTQDARILLHPEPRSVTRLAIPQMVFLHDFMQIKLRDMWIGKLSRYFYVRYKYRQAASVERILTNSEYTRKEALRLFPGLDPDRIRALWLGVRSNGIGPESVKALALPLRCIYVGSLERRKNVFNMLAHLDEIFGDVPFTLEIVGDVSSAQREQVRMILSVVGHENHVVLRGRLTDKELEALMSRSEVTLFPSLDEGFGLPVVEALAHGHLVFAFNNTSIPEVGGTAVILAENNDFAQWGRTLQALLKDPAAGMALRQTGLERAAEFSEAAVRKRFRDYFRELIATYGGS